MLCAIHQNKTNDVKRWMIVKMPKIPVRWIQREVSISLYVFLYPFYQCWEKMMIKRCFCLFSPQCTPVLFSETSFYKAGSTFPETGCVSMPTSLARTLRYERLTDILINSNWLTNLNRVTPSQNLTNWLDNLTNDLTESQSRLWADFHCYSLNSPTLNSLSLCLHCELMYQEQVDLLNL